MSVEIVIGDVRQTLQTLPEQSVQCVVTSPPYFGLRDYGHPGQMGLEQSPEAYVVELVGLFRDVRRVLKDDGTVWLNLGDSYARAGGWSDNSGLDGLARGESGRARTNAPHGVASQRVPNGLKSKDLIGIPWRVAFALQADGWYLRQDIIWHKPNPMPESVRDRCIKAHEYIFLLSKSERYFFDSEAIREQSADPEGSAKRYKSAFGGKKNEALLATDQVHTRPIGMREFDGKRNRRSVWTVATRPYKGAHFATFPPSLIEPCILAGSRPGDTILDPFGGSGTTGMVAAQHGRNAILCELNESYVPLMQERIGLFAEVKKTLASTPEGV